MQIDISGQNLDTGKAFREYAEKVLTKSIDKYFERALSGTIILKKSVSGAASFAAEAGRSPER